MMLPRMDTEIAVLAKKTINPKPFMIPEDACNRPSGLRPIALPLLGAALLLATAAGALTAQAPEADSVPHYNLDSIVVSVLGAPVSVGRAAYPISVAGRADLRAGKTGMFLEEALQSLPGVQVQNRFNYAVGERVTIRGFGSRAQFGVRGIHVVVDGIPATLPDGQSTLDHVDIGSLGRVEALRGPASALYGNASGGVLLFETEVPAQTPLRQEVTLVGGSDGLLRLQSSTAGTVGTTGYRLSVNRLNYDGFRRTAAASGLGPAGTQYGGAERLHINGRLEQPMAGGELGISLNHLDLDAENAGSLTQALFEADATQIAPTYLIFQTGKEVQQSQLGLSWSGPVAGLDAQVAAYGLARDFLNPLPADVVDVDRRAAGGRLTLGGSTQSGDVGISILGGAEMDLQNDDRREYTSNAGQPDALQQNQTESVRSTAAFLQTTVSIQDRVSLVGGVRYDHSHFEVDDLFPVTAGVNEDDSGTRDMNKVSPTVGVHVTATPWIGLYANYSTFFETPSTVELGNRANGSGGFNPDLDPQTGRTIEMGARGAYEDLVAYEVSIFRTQLENELIPFENADQLTYYRNAGSSTRNGWEAILRARPLDFLSGQVSYTETKARFDEYVVNGVDLSDNKVPGLAPRQLQAMLRTGVDAWFLEVDAEYTDEVPVNDSNAAPFTEAYTLFGVRAGGAALQIGRVELSPFAGIQNLTDEKYMSSVTVNAFGGRFYEPGPGRTFYVGGTLAVSR
jgi:iron complex outermembrane receptor protein